MVALPKLVVRSDEAAVAAGVADGCHIVGFESVDDIGAPDFGVPAILGTAAEAARVGLPVVSEGTGLKKWG